MRKALLFAMSLALVFTSCSSDSSSSSSTTGTKLTKIIETYDDGTIENTNFEYNGNKIVSISSDLDLQDETFYTYTGDLITKEESFFDDGEGYSFSEVIDYEYDSNGRLIRSTRTDSSGTDVTVDDFTYNANGTITFTTTENSVLDATGTIYFNGDQPFKKEVTRNIGTTWESVTVEENFFDDKVNPMNSIIGLSKIEIACPTYIWGYGGVSNNVIEVKIDNVTEWSAVYTYNSNNMPATDVYTEPSNPDYNSTAQYIYN